MMLGGCFGNISHCDMSCCDQLTNGLYYDALALTTCGRSEFGLAHRCGQDWFYRVTIGHIYVMPALLDANCGLEAVKSYWFVFKPGGFTNQRKTKPVVLTVVIYDVDMVGCDAAGQSEFTRVPPELGMGPTG